VRLQTLPLGVGKIGRIVLFHARERTSSTYPARFSKQFRKGYSANFAFWAFSEVRLSRIRDGRGVEASEIQVFDEDGLRPSRDGDILDNVGFVSFSDPDGNRWAVQQISFRG
jgi:hypothetical protein